MPEPTMPTLHPKGWYLFQEPLLHLGLEHYQIRKRILHT